jgi:aminoglycoside phosphotransferase family enzyme
VAKLPADSANRDAAALSGAYLREDVAYRCLLPDSPIAAPKCLSHVTEGATAAFLLDDLTKHRFVDQIDGLDVDDATAVAEALARFHRHWSQRLNKPVNPVAAQNVRRATVARLDPEKLESGLAALKAQWLDIGDDNINAFADLVANRERLVDLFRQAAETSGRGNPSGGAAVSPTLCHGDPRADNLCFDGNGIPVLFDWQQIAVQFGEADLAWLASTSLTPATRRSCDEQLLERYGANADRFRLGLVLPGLAALMLAQRAADHPRTRLFISTSLQRIGSAVRDYEVASI